MRPTALAFLASLTALTGLAACGPAATPEAPPAEAAAVAAPMPEGWGDLVLNARMAEEGVLTGGQPTREQLERARDLGFRTVINLRQPDERGSERPQTVRELGMEYVALPVDGAEGLTPGRARELAAALESAERPVLLHCGSGNRVGGLLAVRAFELEGASAEEALAYGRTTGLTRLEPAVRQILERSAGAR